MLAVAALAGACTMRDVPEKSADSATATTGAPAASPAPGAPRADSAGGTTPAATDSAVDPLSRPPAERPRAAMRIEVDTKARRAIVFRGEARDTSYGVAVGSSEWPTQTGEWVISQVVFNPAWIPPDESWAEERKPRDPGDPQNPLGRAQLIYDPPRTIHGTNEPASIGKAVSHGSIRMRNAEIVQLARAVMEAAGVTKDEAWFRAAENRTEKQIVDLPAVVPIRVY